jgi:Malectin domain/IPT/TIG domain
VCSHDVHIRWRSHLIQFFLVSFNNRGDRVFDVFVEGKELADIDLIQYGGGKPNKAIKRDVPVSVLDGFLSLRFVKNDPVRSEPKLSGIEVKLIGVHYAHAVAGGPYVAVDTDANGYEIVQVDASQSHTHGPGQTMTNFTWKLGKDIVGNGERTTLRLPVGIHDVSLTGIDSSGDVNIDTTTITVRPDGYPEITLLLPASGDVAGGTVVAITGSALGGATAVNFGRTVLSGNDFTIVNSTMITVIAPTSALGIPVAVSIVTPFGSSNAKTFTYINSSPIAFTVQKLMDFVTPTAVCFGPDGKLYVASTKGQLGRFTLNDSYDTVVSSVITTVEQGRGIHGIAFDPMETPELGANINVYISTSKIFHKEAPNTSGGGINGKIQKVSGANLEIVTNVITGLPVSELDHSVNGIYFGKSRFATVAS